MAVNAAPMTTATARSMTLPRMMNSLNPLSMSRTPLRLLRTGRAGTAGLARCRRRSGGAGGAVRGLLGWSRRRGRRFRTRFRPRIRAVKTRPVKGNPDVAENLAQCGFATARTHGQRVVGERLVLVEVVSTGRASIRIGGHWRPQG